MSSTATIVYTFASLLAAFSAGVVGWIAWRRADVRGHRLFSFSVMAMGLWALVAGIEAVTPALSAKILLAKLEYVGNSWAAPFLLLFALQYTGQKNWQKGWLLAPLIGLPCITMGIAFSNEFHRLLWSQVTLTPNGTAIFSKGPWFWVSAASDYLVLFTALILLLRFATHSPRYFWRQAAILILGALLPLAGNLLYVFWLSHYAGNDLAPVAFVATGILYAWNFMRFRFLDVVPVAREALVERMQDGMLAIDERGRVVDANAAAITLLGLSASPVGKQASELGEPFAALNEKEIHLVEMKTTHNPPRYLEINFSLLGSTKASGQLAIVRDVTSRRLAEKAERHALLQLEALHQIVQAASSTLVREDFLERMDRVVLQLLAASYFMVATYDQETATWEGVYVRGAEAAVLQRRWPVTEGLSGYAIRTRQPILLNTRKEIDEFIEHHGQRSLTPAAKAIMIAPLISGDRVVGAIGVGNIERENCYSQDDFTLFSLAGAQIAAAFENVGLFSRMQEMATVDPLIKVWNRSHFFNLAAIEVERAQRYKSPLSVIMIDLDHFKRINDEYGHYAGDQALQQIGKIFKQELRQSDIVGRYGGDEFVIILPETSCETANLVAERLRRAIEATQISARSGRVTLTASLGVASLDPKTGLDDLMQRTDRALYKAKQGGRNRVEC